MTNASETVREVCAEMKDQNKSGIAQSYWNDTTVHIVDAWHCVEAYSDRILSAHEREMAAKDAEIERLKEKSCEYALPNHGCTAEDKHFHKTIELERKVALLERALKPMMECKKEHWVIKPENDLAQFRQNATEIFKYESDCVNAVREAQRIMKEGEAK